jgi:small-conductance mechanosensitive channel
LRRRTTHPNPEAPIDLSLAYETLRKMVAGAIASLPRLVAAVLILVVAFIVARVLRWLVPRTLKRARGHESLRLAVSRLVSALAIATFALVAATVAVPSFTVGSLIQLLGVSGVVVGFAFKDIFQNFLAGILILVTEPFDIGDQIAVDTFEGTVEQITARATLICTYDRRRVVVPNADLFTKAVIVNTAFDQRRSEYDLTLPPEIDVERAQARLAEVLHDGIEGVSPDPRADVVLVKVDGTAATVRLRWWSPSRHTDFLIVQDRVLHAVRDALRELQPPKAA